ncbi:MAG: hypothetical protein Tsb0020_51380 [Haliangiales bacterium]
MFTAHAGDRIETGGRVQIPLAQARTMSPAAPPRNGEDVLPKVPGRYGRSWPGSLAPAEILAGLAPEVREQLLAAMSSDPSGDDS